MVHVTEPRRFQGCLTIHRLAIATDNLPIKFEVYFHSLPDGRTDGQNYNSQDCASIAVLRSNMSQNVVLFSKYRHNYYNSFLNIRNLTSTQVDLSTSWQSVLFCSLALLYPRVGHTMDVLSPFISILCHSD